MRNEITTTAQPGRLVKTEENKSSQKPIGFSIIGKIRIGEEKKPSAPGRAIDYFRATGDYADLFIKEYGEKCSKIEIVFPTSDPERACNQRIEGRDKEGNLTAYFDGSTHKIYDDETNGYIPCSEEQFKEAETKGIKVKSGYGQNAKTNLVKVVTWNERLTLRFFLPRIKGIMGVWELSTGAKASSIPNIIRNFDEMVRVVGENISQVPFDLSVKFVKSNKPGNISKFAVLTLTPNISFESAMLLQEFSGMRISGILNDDKIRLLAEQQKALPEHSIDYETGEIEENEDFEVVEEISEPKEIEEPEIIEEPEPEPKQEQAKEFTVLAFIDWIKNEGKEVQSVIGADKKAYEKFLIAFYSICTGQGKEEKERQLEVLNLLFNTDDEELVNAGSAKAFTKWVKAIEIEPGKFIPGNEKAFEQYNMICKYLDTNQGALL